MIRKMYRSRFIHPFCTFRMFRQGVFSTLLVVCFCLGTPMSGWTASTEPEEESRSAGSAGAGTGDGDTVIITREEIQQMGFVSITDLLNRVPGVKAGDTSVSLRGSYKVRVILDGRPINDPASGHGGVKWQMVSLPGVERIEIHKGRGGALYGDDSSGGVILITSSEMDAFHGNIEAYGGNLATRSTQFNVQGNQGAWGLGISGGYEASDGYRTNNDKEKSRAGGRLAYTVGPDTRLSIATDFLRETRGNPGLPAFPTPNARQKDRMVSSVLVAEHGAIMSRTYFNEAHRRNQDKDRYLDSSLQFLKFGEDLSWKNISLGRWGDVGVGAGYEYAQAEGTVIDCREEHSAWVYVSHEITLSSLPLSFSTGLRGNFYSEFHEAFNPELKATYRHDYGTLVGSVGWTNNVPSFLQRYNETSSTRPNPDLSMERATNYSISIIPKMPSNLSATLSLFYNRITDRITYVRGDDGIGRYENFGKVSTKGIEGALGWSPTENLQLNVTYMYMEAVDDTTGLWLSSRPRHQVRTDIRFLPVENLSLSFSTNFASMQYTRADNKESIPSSFTGDLRAEYRWDHGITLFTEIKNIWDVDYLYGDGYPAPPLTGIAGIKYSF